MDHFADLGEPTPPERPELPTVPDGLQKTATVLVASLGLMWLIEIVDTVVLSDRLQRGGIHPRALDGLDGILWAPWLHAGFGHLIANSVPLLVLGGLVGLRGMRTLAPVTAVVIVVGGAATWLLARSGNHIGASGLVFGYLGYLIGAALFERSLKAIVLAAIAGFFYWSLVFGLIPVGQVSWEGHLFGAVSGAAVAWVLAKNPSALEPPTT